LIFFSGLAFCTRCGGNQGDSVCCRWIFRNLSCLCPR
jgi:hypothetical protein